MPYQKSILSIVVLLVLFVITLPSWANDTNLLGNKTFLNYHWCAKKSADSGLLISTRYPCNTSISPIQKNNRGNTMLPQSSWFKDIIPVLIGGLLSIISGAITAFYTLKRTSENELKLKKEQEERYVNGLLMAVYNEIGTVFNRYYETIGYLIDRHPEGEPFIYIYPLSSDFFPTYDQNTSFLGRIPETDLRRSIFKTYTLAKAMVDSFKMNNKLISDRQEKQTPENNRRLVEYFKGMKQTHDTLKEEVQFLLKGIEEKLEITND